MLVLGRKVNESIRIGDHILLKVIAIQEGQIKLGIEAPADVKILRTEVYEQAVLSNRQAASARKDSIVAIAKQLPTTGDIQSLPIKTVKSVKKKNNV
jgi:carbon storage regulator